MGLGPIPKYFIFLKLFKIIDLKIYYILKLGQSPISFYQQLYNQPKDINYKYRIFLLFILLVWYTDYIVLDLLLFLYTHNHLGLIFSWYKNSLRRTYIANKGLKPGTCNAYGVGIYCTPNISTSEGYTPIFQNPMTHKWHKIVFQNRVKPIKKIPILYYYLNFLDILTVYNLRIYHQLLMHIFSNHKVFYILILLS